MPRSNAIFHRHQRFYNMTRNSVLGDGDGDGDGEIEVGLDDGIWAVRMGMAAQISARTGQAVRLTSHD